jgi:hypothetical protein
MTQTLDFSDKNVPNNVRSINMGIFFPKGEKPSISWKFCNCRILMPKELSQFIYKYVPWESEILAHLVYKYIIGLSLFKSLSTRIGL